jgi:hypothetical protein
MIPMTTDGLRCEFQIKVVPNASRDRLVGPLGDALKIQVTAAPEAGRANAAVVRLLAKSLGIKRQQVSIVAGHAKQTKRVAVIGMPADKIGRQLAAWE